MSGAITVGVIAVGGSMAVGASIGTALVIGAGAAAVGEVTGANEWVADNITDPVLQATADVVEGFFDDPLKTIATVAAVATGNAWAIPLINGADVALAGGDLGQVLTSMAVSYVAGEAGAWIGDTVGTYVGDFLSDTAIGESLNNSFLAEMATAAQYGTDLGSAQTAALLAQDVGINSLTTAIGGIIGGATAGAATATVLGGDPLDAALTSLISSSSKYVMNAVTGSSPAFDGLSDNSKNVIESSVSTILVGGDLSNVATQAATDYAMSISEGVGWLSANTLGRDLDLNTAEGQQTLAYREAIASTVLANAYAAAFAGGDVPAAITGTFTQVGLRELGDKIVEFGTGAIDDITKAYDEADTYASLIDDAQSRLDTKNTEYQNFINGILDEVDAVDSLGEEANDIATRHNANPTQSTLDQYNAKKAEYDKAIAELQTKFDTVYTPQRNQYEADLAALQEEYTGYAQAYEAANTLFVNSFDRFDLFTTESTAAAQESLVDFITEGEFDAAQYVDMYGDKVDGLTVDNAVQHFFEQGQYGGLSVSLAEEADRKEVLYNEFTTKLLEADVGGRNLTNLSPEDLRRVLNYVDQAYPDALSLYNALDTGVSTVAQNIMGLVGTESGTLGGLTVNSSTRPQLEALGYTNLVDGEALTNLQAFDLRVTNPGYNSGADVALPEGTSYADLAAQPWKYYVDYSSGTPTWNQLSDAPILTKTAPGVGVYAVRTDVVNGQVVNIASVQNAQGEWIQVLESDINRLADVDYYNAGIDELYNLDSLADIKFITPDPQGPLQVYVNGTVQTPENIDLSDQLVATGFANISNEQVYDFLSGLFTDIGDEYNELVNQMGKQEEADNNWLIDQLGLRDLAGAFGDEVLEYGMGFLAMMADTVDEEDHPYLRNLVAGVISEGGEVLSAHLQSIRSFQNDGLAEDAKALLITSQLLSAEAGSPTLQKGIDRWDALFDPKEGEPGYIDPNWSPLSKGLMSAVNFVNATASEPEAFIFGKAIPETIGEIPNIVVGLATGTLSKSLLTRSTQLSTGVVNRMAKGLGLAAETTIDMNEAFGGTYISTYQKTYNEAIKAGFSDTDAMAMAEENSQTAAAWAAATVGVISAGGAATGADLMSNLLNRTLRDEEAQAITSGIGLVADKVTKALQTTVFESATEAFEEGSASYIGGQYIAENINPDYDYVKDALNDAVVAAALGATTTTNITVMDGIYNMGKSAGSATIDSVMRTFSPTYATAVDSAAATGSTDAVADVLKNFGITEPSVQLEINNTYFDESVQTLDEVYQQSQDNHSYFDFNDTDLTQFTGYKTAQDSATALDSYVDPRYMDADEVRRAAVQEGVYLTQDQARELADQGTSEAELITQLREQYDPYGVTRDEIAARYAELGYTPTAAELNEYAPADISSIPSGNAILQAATSGSAYDPRYDVNGDGRVSAADAIKALRYQVGLENPYETASVEFLRANNLIGQEGADETNQSEIFNAIEAYIPTSGNAG